MAERGLGTANKRLIKLIEKRTGSCLRNWREKGADRSERGAGGQRQWV